MVWNQEAVTVSPEEQEFIRLRSKATSEHFMLFVTRRGLDMDYDTWPMPDREEFDREEGQLVEEWKARADRMFGV